MADAWISNIAQQFNMTPEELVFEMTNMRRSVEPTIPKWLAERSTPGAPQPSAPVDVAAIEGRVAQRPGVNVVNSHPWERTPGGEQSLRDRALLASLGEPEGRRMRSATVGSPALPSSMQGPGDVSPWRIRAQFGIPEKMPIPPGLVQWLSEQRSAGGDVEYHEPREAAALRALAVKQAEGAQDRMLPFQDAEGSGFGVYRPGEGLVGEHRLGVGPPQRAPSMKTQVVTDPATKQLMRLVMDEMGNVMDFQPLTGGVPPAGGAGGVTPAPFQDRKNLPGNPQWSGTILRWNDPITGRLYTAEQLDGTEPPEQVYQKWLEGYTASQRWPGVKASGSSTTTSSGRLPEDEFIDRLFSGDIGL